MPPMTTMIRNRPQIALRKVSQRSFQLAFGWRGKSNLRARYQVTKPSIVARTMPGTTPAMKSAPTDVLVATEYMTMTIDGGIRMPSAPEVVMTPAPKRDGKPALTIAGSRIEPMATTVAGDEPDTAANSAQATTPARPRPPYQWPTMAVAKLIMRRATPPCVRKLPA